MLEINFTPRTAAIIEKAIQYASNHRHEFVTPEHILYFLLEEYIVKHALSPRSSEREIIKNIVRYLQSMESVPEDLDYKPALSSQSRLMFDYLAGSIETSSASKADISHLFNALFNISDCWGTSMILEEQDYDSYGDFIHAILYPKREVFEENDPPDWEPGFWGGPVPEEQLFHQNNDPWRKLVTCMNDTCLERNPLVGREKELHRTIQVLCRKDKNNPLHVGEPGVGKTALIWGLARLIVEDKVPERLKGSKIYMMDIASIIAGTQYRGDFENRLKEVMDGIRTEGKNNIIYIDEIHNLIGAGATGEGSLDASNFLKPYLEDGSIRFIGSTTYEEYNRYFSRSKGMIRRFQQIDIEEPSVEEAKNIMRQLQPRYENFHHVKYSPKAIEFAVEASARYVNDRFLPDKAIDLIDESGAAMELAENKRTIGVKEISETLARICKVDTLAMAEKDDVKRMKNLSRKMLSKIYGQDQAISQIVESVQMARAGLMEENKPLASLLFVGPTGVGKTEVARVLASEIGVELIRFDMSEYAEKHSVAKLIGSPAGYIGYEDGGLLVDAIRKSPNCVLLLDEIEKAHEDIYNILLQVMDYARLSDNKGRQADFRNVVIIMTSNAGAQFASQAGVGFTSSVTRGGAMLRQVKKTFKPEFLNRLSGTVVFNDMDRRMASQILRKKILELNDKLLAKKVVMTVSQKAFSHLLKEGFTPEYGAREMDRVIQQQLKPLFMREILFGSLRKGGEVIVDFNDGKLMLSPKRILLSDSKGKS